MDIYHVGDTSYRDFLLRRKESGEYIDPADAVAITVNVRINGVYNIILSGNLTSNVYIVMDIDGFNRVRVKFNEGDLATPGIYQLQLYVEFAASSETSYEDEFKVAPLWT